MSDQEDIHYTDSFNAAIDEVVDWSQGNPDAEERRVVVSYPGYLEQFDNSTLS